jgi:hypothetical protein
LCAARHQCRDTGRCAWHDINVVIQGVVHGTTSMS